MSATRAGKDANPRKSEDDEVYGNREEVSTDEVRNGNPGRPQSDYESPEVSPDEAPRESVHDAPAADAANPLAPTVQRQAAAPEHSS